MGRGGGQGLRHDFRPLSPFAPKEKPSGRILPETSYNPLKGLSVKTCFNGGGREIGQVFL